MNQLSSNISIENVDFNGKEETVIEWGDSDIPYLGLINSPTKIERSVSRGIKKCKIGAKITEPVQPLDVGPFFKTMKSSSRTTTTLGTDNPLRSTVIGIFKDLSLDNSLRLPANKSNAIIDCISSFPEMGVKCFSSKKNYRLIYREWIFV